MPSLHACAATLTFPMMLAPPFTMRDSRRVVPVVMSPPMPMLRGVRGVRPGVRGVRPGVRGVRPGVRGVRPFSAVRALQGVLRGVIFVSREAQAAATAAAAALKSTAVPPSSATVDTRSRRGPSELVSRWFPVCAAAAVCASCSESGSAVRNKTGKHAQREWFSPKAQ